MGPHFLSKALVTGAAQGLGLAIAKELISQGCKQLVLVDVDEAQGLDRALELRVNGVQVTFIKTDMGNVAEVTSMVDQANAVMGGINVFANAAGNTERGSILDTSVETWDRINDVNAKGPFFALQRFAQLAIEAGHSATALNILSIVVHGGTPVLAPYGASKASLLYTSKNAANTLAKHHIRVNGINVGWMDTPGEDDRQKASHGRPDGWQDAAIAKTSFGALVKPEEVARLAAFLLGPQSGVVTGSIIDFEEHVVGAYPDTDDI